MTRRSVLARAYTVASEPSMSVHITLAVPPQPLTMHPGPAIARDSVIVGSGQTSAIVAGKVMLNPMVSGPGVPSAATMASFRLNPSTGLLQLSLCVSTGKVTASAEAGYIWARVTYSDKINDLDDIILNTVLSPFPQIL